MPTYEYECSKCKKVYEQFQSITEEPLKKCKYCKGKVKRLIGAGGGIIFKGNGFYATDYRKSEYKEKQKKDAPPCPAEKSGSCKNCPKANG